MGLWFDDENRSDSRRKNSSVDIREMETQRIDSDDVEDGEHDNFLYLSDTMPIDDACSTENSLEAQFGDLAGETQLVDPVDETELADLEGESQLLDLAGETQLLDLVDETQVVDDPDCVEHMPHEFLDEITTKNSMEQCETQVLSQNGNDNMDACISATLKDRVDNQPPKDGYHICMTPSNTVVNSEHHSGSVSKGFTSVRAASIRASGLAACARGCIGISFCSSKDKTSVERKKCKLDNSSPLGYCSESERHLGNKKIENNGELKDANKCKTGGTAMRKLFRENDYTDLNLSGDDVDHAVDNPNMPELPTSDNCLAGLSYADSQEPGELSQIHALEVVDKFLDRNAMELEEGFGSGFRNTENLNFISSAKGSLNLVKTSIGKCTDREHRIYDWDNIREDDGGGDFFQKKKKLFFDKGGTEPRKGRHNNAGSVERCGNVGNKDAQCRKDKLGDTVSLDSKLMLQNLRGRGKSLECRDDVFDKKSVNNLDEQLQRVSGHDMADNGKCNDGLEMNTTIGPDTQMAAEAIENLCFVVQLDDNNNSASDKGRLALAKQTTRKRKESASLEEQPITETLCPTRAAVSKEAKQSKKIKKNHDAMPEVAEQRKLTGMEATCQRSAGPSDLKEQHDVSIPVAKRTRKCLELNNPTVATNSFDPTGEIKDLMSSPILKKKRTGANVRSARIVTIEQLKRIGLAAHNQSKKRLFSTVNALNVDVMDNGQGKKSEQEILTVGRAIDTCSGEFERPRVAPKSDNEKSGENTKGNSNLEASPSTSACRTPASCVKPVKNVSPICMGDEYLKQSCRNSLSKTSLIKEIDSLATPLPGHYDRTIELRKRKDITQVKVLFSQHLADDVVKQQKKILCRLGGGVVASMSEATHFVADEFVRTRNMLEAIACGKPVVTHLWLESCGQANCLIDEKNYILRDAKKEKEFGFCLPVSLSRASQHPLLQGQKVFITPNTKPGKETLVNLVKAVAGLPIERLGRSVLNSETPPDNLLILTCEEDYDHCVPFLEKGGAVYSSELLLNGIVKQKLEFERHLLFLDQLKRTRSTVWVKKNNRYVAATKCKVK
ncbi:uncharacterized protein LOC127266606 [Andrographis paniculata]|uniref:uncharacterized protein LOC127266606 n=1 Tax=Andrographis paniculata TaxID=175694 RepID=UPI0021E8BEF5|nr:uncharacterized protein LOC127266606 [Andrographis paniculata]XP_051152864.1 uncharacterized protein LOC127266606 [Andrographis paniculata]